MELGTDKKGLFEERKRKASLIRPSVLDPRPKLERTVWKAGETIPAPSF